MKINEILREQIKNEIPSRRCCLVTALKVALRLYGTLHITGRGFMVEFKKEDPALLRRTIRLFKEAFPSHKDLEILFDDKKYWVQIYAPRLIWQELNLFSEKEGFLPDISVKKECCRMQLVREVLLYKGYMVNFEEGYQLEIREPGPFTQVLLETLHKWGIKHYTYPGRLLIKGGEHLFAFLNCLRGQETIDRLTRYREFKKDKDQTVRLTNYSMANLNRQVDGYEKIRLVLEEIRKGPGLEALSPPLREVAWLRLENPGATLSELGKMARPPLTKGGVSSRLRRIVALFEQWKEES
ncbi:MAG TPA: DNA-binding protein WhiA [Candidatus Mcinerneyibacteriales bacterium]|nr:DNA-binding protein WhiA [Candidatus Mcinerneyibacteriales bacterium]